MRQLFSGDWQVPRRVQSFFETLLLQLLQHSLWTSLPESEATIKVRRQEAPEVHYPREAVPALVWKPLCPLRGGQQLHRNVGRK